MASVLQASFWHCLSVKFNYLPQVKTWRKSWFYVALFMQPYSSLCNSHSESKPDLLLKRILCYIYDHIQLYTYSIFQYFRLLQPLALKEPLWPVSYGSKLGKSHKVPLYRLAKYTVIRSFCCRKFAWIRNTKRKNMAFAIIITLVHRYPFFLISKIQIWKIM